MIRNSHSNIRKDSTHLYFVALIPHWELREEVKSLKEFIYAQFGARHALKSPAHITLQMPFKRKEKAEDQLIDALGNFAKNKHPFHVDLKGFGCFPPRVIYINVSDHTPIVRLHGALQEILRLELNFRQQEMTRRFHPHLTLATRDLSKDAFSRAWAYFKDLDFSASFLVDRLFLLKHNRRFWEIHKEFLF